MKNRQSLHTIYYIPNPTSLRDGYIAITSAIMISLLVMAITFSVSLTGYFARFNTLTTEFKEISSFLAEACVEKALLSLAANSNYAGNENITVNGRQCAIFPIEISGSDKIIKTKATVENAVTNLKVQAASVNLSITSWEELPNL